MNDKGLNLLIAVSGSDESVIGSIKEAFGQCDIVIGRCDVRTGKGMIMQYLSSNPETDAIILSQHQGGIQFQVADIDNISTMIPDIRIIVIVDEEKGSSYMRELESCAIFTALYEEDADYKTIAGLIRSGRSKRDARIYYGVSGRDSIQEKNFDADNAVAYLSSYDGTIEDLTKRMVILSKRLSSTSVMLDVLAALPEDIFIMVSRIERYTDLCGLVEEKKFQLVKQVEDSEPKRKRNKTVKEKHTKVTQNPKRLTNVDVLNMEGKRETIDVGFISTNVGVGCTTSAIMFAHVMSKSKKKLRVAIVEFDNTDANFFTLCKIATGDRNTSGLSSFTIGEVDYYFDTTYSKFTAQCKPLYDVVVYDFGCCDNGTIKDYFLRLDTKFVVCSSKEWHLGEFADFLTDVSPFDVNDSFVYLFPCVHKKLDMGVIAEFIPHNNLFAALPYESNPFVPSKEIIRIFEEICKGTYKKKVYKKVVRIDEKIGMKPVVGKWRFISMALLATLTVCVVSLSLVLGLQARKYDKLQQHALNNANESEDKITLAQEENTNLTKQLSGLDLQVYFLKGDVAPGEIITDDMVEMRVIKTSLDSDLFLGVSALGKVAAIAALSEGEPLLYSMLAEPTEEFEDIPEELLREIESISMEVANE